MYIYNIYNRHLFIYYLYKIVEKILKALKMSINQPPCFNLCMSRYASLRSKKNVTCVDSC